MEAAGLGIFMISACLVATLLEHPSSPARQLLAAPLLRRTLMGLVMGATAVGIIYSPWGQQSGAHINPSITLTFLRLGKVKGWDAVFYTTFQFLGGAAGVALAALILSRWLSHPSVNYVVTVPGAAGTAVAFAAELAISCGLMITVLFTTNSARWSRYTGLFAGAMVAIYIMFEAPLSGMSLNPARTLASALVAGEWAAIWLYFTAPVLGMLLGAELYLRRRGTKRIYCAKLNHHTRKRCIFRCGYG